MPPLTRSLPSLAAPSLCVTSKKRVKCLYLRAIHHPMGLNNLFAIRPFPPGHRGRVFRLNNLVKGLINQSFVKLVLIIDKNFILVSYAPLIAKKAYFRYLHGEHTIEYALS